MIVNEKTIEELKERLRNLDELTILELLDISSEELVEFLSDQIEYKYDQLIEYLNEPEEDDY
jgi:uncharacterized protein with WD repeat